MGLREAAPLAVIEHTHPLKLTKLEKQQKHINNKQNIKITQCQGKIKRNPMEMLQKEVEAEEKYEQQQQLYTYTANEHNQQTLTIATKTTTKNITRNESLTCEIVQQRSRRKSSKTRMHKALKCLKKCLTTICFFCLFVSTPTITPTTTTSITKTNAVTATILSLTSVLLHVPFIAASSLRTKNEQQAGQQQLATDKNHGIYFARPWTESLVNGEELGVEVQVEMFTESAADVQDSAGLDIVVNDLEPQSTSNEQQLLAYYERAKQQLQRQKYIENHQRRSLYDFDERVTKRAATKRSVATPVTIVSTPINLSLDMTTVAHDKTTAKTAATTTMNSEFSPSYKNLESLSSVIDDGELAVQESTLLDDKCVPKVLNSVPMEPVSFKNVMKKINKIFNSIVLWQK